MAMGAYDYLKRLQREDFRSSLFYIPFLLGAVNDGVITEDQLAPVIPMINYEVGPHASQRDAADRAGSVRTADPNLVVNPTPEFVAARLAESLYQLASEYPETGEVVGVIGKGCIAKGLSANGWWGFCHAVRLEYMWQRIIEDHFWNNVYLPILLMCGNKRSVEIMAAANTFLEGQMIGKSSPYPDNTRALAIQMPILGAAIAAGIKAAKKSIKLRRIGLPDVVMEVDGRKMAVEPPVNGSLDTAVLQFDRRHPAKRVVSLPLAGRDHLGSEIWQELMQTPFFLRHRSKLAPSNSFWGLEYPPDAEGLAAMRLQILRELPEGTRELLPEDRGELFKAAGGEKVILAGQRDEEAGKSRITRVLAVPKSGSSGEYEVIAEDGAANKMPHRPDASLRIAINGGQLTGGKYIISGGSPEKTGATVIVRREQANILRARARENYTPYVVAPDERDAEIVAKQLLTSGQPSPEFAATVAALGGMISPLAATPMSLSQLLFSGGSLGFKALR